MKPRGWQKKMVREQLLKDGSCTRNWALANRITRLAAIILTLDLEVVGARDGGDYRYTLVNAPKPKPKSTFREEFYTDEMGRPQARWIEITAA